jgi:hypothetical protein
MTANDHWVEILRCPRCKNTGTAALSEAGGSIDIKVELVSEGFRIFKSEQAMNFYCSSCDCPAEL